MADYADSSSADHSVDDFGDDSVDDRVDEPVVDPVHDAAQGPVAAVPAGDVYDWYMRGRDLLSRGDAAAAVQILTHTVAAEPTSRSAREMLARAQFDARQYEEAAANFTNLVDTDPADHYAHFGLGLATRKMNDLAGAIEHLALAAAMRPDLERYSRELRAARAAAGRRARK